MGLTRANGGKGQCRKSLLLKGNALEEKNKVLQKKYDAIVKNEIRCEKYNIENSEIVFVAYGMTSRICDACIDMLAEEGIKAGCVRPITLWPFPYEEISSIARNDKNKNFIVVEMSAGQMVEDVRLAVQDDKRVRFVGRMGGGVPTEEEIIIAVKEALKKQLI